MRYRLAALMLMALLLLMSAMTLPAAPVPDPSAVLDIGPPPKGKTADEHCKDTIRLLTDPKGYLRILGGYAKRSKQPSVARLKDVPSWLERDFRVKEEGGGRRLRFTFRAGTRAEQVVLINALLRSYHNGVTQSIKDDEEFLNKFEGKAKEWAEASKEERDPTKKAELQDMAEGMIKKIAPVRAEVDRAKQIKVIKWAK
jgi:hypothetical protein